MIRFISDLTKNNIFELSIFESENRDAKYKPPLVRSVNISTTNKISENHLVLVNKLPFLSEEGYRALQVITSDI